MGVMPKARFGGGIGVHANSGRVTLPSIPVGSAIQKLSNPYFYGDIMKA